MSVLRSKIWKKIWDKQSAKDNTSTAENLFKIDGFSSRFPKENQKKNWNIYIKNMFKNIKFKKNFNILEYGCGAGGLLKFYNNKGYNLYGIDYSKNILKIGKKLLPNIRFKHGDISSIDFYKKNFDLIISHSVFHYFDNHSYAKLLIKGMLKTLKVNGQICILDIPDKNKEVSYKKNLIKILGNKLYKSKYKTANHLFYKKKFFKDIANVNKLEIRIQNQNFKLYENSKYRFNVYLKKIN